MQTWGYVASLACTLLVANTTRSDPPDQPWYPQAPPFPAATGEIIRVETVSQLFAAVEQVRPGGTILLADGIYAMPRYFDLHTNDVTLRGERGQRDSVILDGTGSHDGELVGVSHCSGVTIADLTIQNIKWNGFKINSDKHATHVTIRNCVIHLWNESQECVVERNVIIDCDCGICLGNHYRHEQTRWHDDRCIVRNNFVTRCAETGILTAHTRNCLVVHNTVHDPTSSLRRLLWVQDDNEGLLAANNLLSGPDVLNTGSGQVTLQNNVALPDLTDQFIDAAAGNLRWKRSVPSNCVRMPEALLDIDGHQRADHPSAGAAECLPLDHPHPQPR